MVGVPDARMGEVGCAWVVPDTDTKPDPDEVISYCRAELARYKVPAYVLFTTADQLPLTVSGKVQKFRLADLTSLTISRLGLGRRADLLVCALPGRILRTSPGF